MSLSIAETNKLRAKLGLAPLELNEGSSSTKANDEKFTEDGLPLYKDQGATMEFAHRKPENWGEKKRETMLKEKLEVSRFPQGC